MPYKSNGIANNQKRSNKEIKCGKDVCVWKALEVSAHKNHVLLYLGHLVEHLVKKLLVGWWPHSLFML